MYSINLKAGRGFVVKLLATLCFTLLLVACGDPHDTKVPADISKWSETVRPALQKLKPEERVLFSQYAIRHMNGATVGGLIGDKADPIPEDMTIGKAIEEQRKYIAQEQVKEPEEKALKDKTGK
jgi:hypothetical protein